MKEKPPKEEKPQAKSEIAWRYDSMNINLNSLPVSDEIPYMDLAKCVPA